MAAEEVEKVQNMQENENLTPQSLRQQDKPVRGYSAETKEETKQGHVKDDFG